jgi:hypothetical protein
VNTEKIKRILGHKTRKDTHIKFYKTMVPPCLMYGSETWALRRQMKDDWKQQRCGFYGIYHSRLIL